MGIVDTLPQFTFNQTWGGVEWISEQDYGNDETIINKQIDAIIKPNDDLCAALDSMFSAYYSGDLINIASSIDGIEDHNDYLPWVYHKKLYSAFIENKCTEEHYRKTLKTILRSNWILSWHWRAVLPTLKNWDAKSFENSVTIIQVSHFRKWEMLLCYKVSKEKLDTIESLKEIPLCDKNLLRAPLFGISHRLKGWDTYRLFYNQQVLDYIKNKVILHSNNPQKNDISTVLGRHDCYYIVNDIEKLSNGYKWTLKCSIETEPEICKIDKTVLGDKNFTKPLDLIEVPTFEGNDGINQLLSSDNYCEAIYELMEILNDPTAKSVLLIAPPGSGKEELAKFTFHCRERKKVGAYIATTLAGLNATEVSRLLFSCSKNLIEDNNIDDYKPRSSDGLIIRALDGALFIDEIDKADKSVRNLLLRVLESGEITDPITSNIIKIKNRQPLYIFSGSMSRKDMFQESPPDFWTRISHIIEVSHPLAIDDLVKSNKVVKDYLWMFWTLHVKAFMKDRGLVIDDKNPYTEHLIKYNIQLFGFLLDSRTVNFVCEILADEISGRGKPLVSIRTLRSIIARSLFKFLEVIQFAKFDYEPIEIFKWKNKTKFKGLSYEEWFEELLRIISIDLFEKQKKQKQICPIQLGVLESFKSAIRLGTILAK